MILVPKASRMNAQHTIDQGRGSRRTFLKSTCGTVAGATLTSALAARSYAGEDNTIKLAIVGCGGRGTGALVNALSTSGPTKLWAMADVFGERLQSSLGNVFMEKSFAVDAPGIRRVLQAGRKAEQKNLKIAGGLMSRHYPALQEAIVQIHDGAIGNIITCWAYRQHGPVGFKPRVSGMSELAHQIRNYSNFTWLNGSFILDWLIHNLDVCCWAKGGWPVSAQGQDGRQVRTEPDQMFDHHAVEYTFADGTRMFAQGRHIAACRGFSGDVIHGTTGSAVLGEGIRDPRIYKGYNQTNENRIWQYEGQRANPYQVEHDRLFAAIREDLPYNETERCAHAAMTGILGRMAAESGQQVTWEDALASNLELAPGLDKQAWDSDAPVMPDENGRYPVAMPGSTIVL
jgi:predicted dehydrogenase